MPTSQHAELLNALDEMQASHQYAARKPVLRNAETLIYAQEQEIIELKQKLKGQPVITAECKRMWINQPSKDQPLHRLHGTNVILVPRKGEDETVTVYFTSGVIVSQMVPKNVLSEGWKW